MKLAGRTAELARIQELLANARNGMSGALVLRGDPGIGKSALLAQAQELAADFTPVAISGIESEMAIDYASLHQLHTRLGEPASSLPDPQHEAIEVAFGRQAGPAPDRFLVALATLTTLSNHGGRRPVLCVIDDWQWLDAISAQALAFVARRLHADSVAMLVATREQHTGTLAGLDDMYVSALGDRDARKILRSAVVAPIDRRVEDRAVREAKGNPLVLLELARSLRSVNSARRANRASPTITSDLAASSFRQRIEQLSPGVFDVVLVAAVEPLGDPHLLGAAIDQLGHGSREIEHAAEHELLTVADIVAFHHPLIRSTVYEIATPEQRRRAHDVLAAVIDPTADPERRAWHRGQAASEPDENLAAELAAAADRALARGGCGAAGAFLERSSELSPDPAKRAQRALHAAQAMHMGGASNAAQGLLAVARAGPLDEGGLAELDLLEARAALYPTFTPEAPNLLLAAAAGLRTLDPRLARETYVEAYEALIYAGHSDDLRSVATAAATVASAAADAPPAPSPPRPVDLLLDGLTTRFTAGVGEALPQLTQALHALCDDAHGERWLSIGLAIAYDLWDDALIAVLNERNVELARRSGALTLMPNALAYLASAHLLAGRFDDAQQALDDCDAISAAIGAPATPYVRSALAAWRGRADITIPMTDTGEPLAVTRREDNDLRSTHYATAIQEIGTGHYDVALTAALAATETGLPMVTPGDSHAEVVEAAVRSEQRDAAEHAAAFLSEHAAAVQTDWALGIDALNQALLASNDDAEARYQESIERLARTNVPIALARAHLLYGEWLRRRRRRVDARHQLRTALDMCETIGMEGFAQRAANELRATGESARRRTTTVEPQLTAQQAQIARMASEGHSNQDIAAQLFISQRTVEYHLRNVFVTLGITSRTQLTRVL